MNGWRLDRWRSGDLGLHATVLAVAGFVSTVIAYVSVTQFPLADSTVNDSLPYAAMTAHAPWDTIPKPFRWRVLVPILADLGPHADPAQIQLVWGAIDAVALTLAAWFFFLLLRRRKASQTSALLGVTFFFASWVVLRFSGMVLVDAASYAVLAAGVYAAAARRTVLLLAAVTVGMFVKETTVLVVLVVLLLDIPRPERLRQLGACAPGVVGYAVLRLATPTDLGYSYSVDRVLEALHTLVTPHGVVFAVAQLVLTFGPFWLLALLGWRGSPDHPPILPRRTAWLVPVVLMVPYLIGSNLGRVWFLAFPVVLAFAVGGVAVLTETTRQAEASGDAGATTPSRPDVPAAPSTTGCAPPISGVS